MGKPANSCCLTVDRNFMSKGSWWNPERWWLEDDCTFLLGWYYFQGLLLLNFRWVKVWVCVCIVSKHFFKARSLMNYQLHFWEGWEPDSSWSFCISTIYIIDRMIFRQPKKKGNQSIRSRIVFLFKGTIEHSEHSEFSHFTPDKLQLPLSLVFEHQFQPYYSCTKVSN